MDGRFQYFLSPAIFYWGIFQCCVRAQVLTFLLALALQIKLNEYDNHQFIAIWKVRVCFPICLQRAIKESAKTPKALTSELNGNRCLFEIDRIIAAIHSYLTKIPTTMWREYGQVFAQRPILSNLTLRELRTASPSYGWWWCKTGQGGQRERKYLRVDELRVHAILINLRNNPILCTFRSHFMLWLLKRAA